MYLNRHIDPKGIATPTLRTTFSGQVTHIKAETSNTNLTQWWLHHQTSWLLILSTSLSSFIMKSCIKESGLNIYPIEVPESPEALHVGWCFPASHTYFLQSCQLTNRVNPSFWHDWVSKGLAQKHTQKNRHLENNWVVGEKKEMKSTQQHWRKWRQIASTRPCAFLPLFKAGTSDPDLMYALWGLCILHIVMVVFFFPAAPIHSK